MAVPTMPFRSGRPIVSATTTATSPPAAADSRARSADAEASGSTGSSTAVSGPAALERSMPALAQTKP